MNRIYISLLFILGLGLMRLNFIQAQEIKHPDMETMFNEQGEEIVVVVQTHQPPDPRFYEVKEEEAARGMILVVYYKPTGDIVTIFGKTTIKGKVEGPGVSLFFQRMPPQIEKVIGQKSFIPDIKKRYLESILFEKYELLDPGRVDLGEIDRIIKRKRN